MRSFIVAAVVSIFAQAAQAADWPEDFPALRGGFSETTARGNWEGFYVGGQFGYSAATLDVSNANRSMTNYMLRETVLQDIVSNWSLLQSKNASGTGFGGFVGRNWQWEDAVIGLEINYSSLSGVQNTSTGALSLLVNPSNSNPPPNYTYTYSVGLSGAARAEIKDVMTLRARAGWDAGTYMPYAFGGVALGRVNVSRSAAINVVRNEYYTDPNSGTTTLVAQPNVSPNPSTMSEAGVDSITGGYTVGVGAEMNLVGGLFARAEWEYVRFLKVKDVAASMNSARVGIGYKF